MFNSVLVSPFGLIRYWSIWSYSVLYSPLWSYLVHCVQFSPLQCIWSYSVHFGHSLSTKVLFGPFGLIGFYSIHFGPLCSIRSSSVHSVHFGLIQSYSIHFGLILSIWSNLAILNSPKS